MQCSSRESDNISGSSESKHPALPGWTKKKKKAGDLNNEIRKTRPFVPNFRLCNNVINNLKLRTRARS